MNGDPRTDSGLQHLLPRPRSLAPSGERVLIDGAFAPGDAPAATRAPELVARACERRGLARAPGSLALAFVRDARLAPEGYRLELRPGLARIAAADERGSLWGAATLAQIVLAAPAAGRGLLLPGLCIEDAPALARRGVLLDVSRERVPTLETLERLVVLLAGWKLNELQLYTEHTFAYAGHEEVWRASGALTPDDIRRLDRFCRSYGIELVPNQQSFGHLHRWLALPRYRPLAECPEGLEHPFSPRPEPFSLCPSDPGALVLLEDLYDQLLPCFASRELHVGLDETIDLGRGRSRAECAQRGVGALHMDFLCALHERVAARGRRMWFWADVVLHHPAVLARLPRDVVACAWGYEAAHDFDGELARLAAAGVASVACPGTSSWKSFAGRPANMAHNVAAAALAAERHGALGLLMTDWGDQGHLQPLPVSFPGWAAAAARAWRPAAQAPGLEELEEPLDRDAFGGARGATRALWELGRAGERLGYVKNASLPFQLVLRPDAFPSASGPSDEQLARALDEVERARGHLPAPADAEQRLWHAELGWAADALAFACRLGRARQRAPGSPPEGLPPAARAPLAAELAALIGEHRRQWPLRSRPDGLTASAAWLEALHERLAPSAAASVPPRKIAGPSANGPGRPA